MRDMAAPVTEKRGPWVFDNVHCVADCGHSLRGSRMIVPADFLPLAAGMKSIGYFECPASEADKILDYQPVAQLFIRRLHRCSQVVHQTRPTSNGDYHQFSAWRNCTRCVGWARDHRGVFVGRDVFCRSEVYCKILTRVANNFPQCAADSLAETFAQGDSNYYLRGAAVSLLSSPVDDRLLINASYAVR